MITSSPPNDADHFFEGAEKLLEVWFGSSHLAAEASADLRKIAEDEWRQLLRVVKCSIISKVSSDDIDAYLLSESSLFVSRNRFILKTCGRTTLLPAIPILLQLVLNNTEFDTVLDLFYSRKKFERPDLQHDCHQNFYDEVDFLDKIFQNGAAFVMGRCNVDPWYLYTLETNGICGRIEHPDQTIEVLMTELPECRMRPFYRVNCPSAALSRKMSGIDQLCAEAACVDDYLFDPCGYSLNAVLENDVYCTMHITPEPEFSYVSFESNMTGCYRKLVSQLVDLFQPGNFIVTIVANQASNAKQNVEKLTHMVGYHTQDHMSCMMKNYLHYYARFVRIMHQGHDAKS